MKIKILEVVMKEENIKKDNSFLYIALVGVIAVSAIAVVKSNESDKYASIQSQLDSELKQMNIRVLK